MYRTGLFIRLFAVVCIVFFYSCKNGTSRKFSYNDKKYQVSVNVPNVGEKYYYTITNETQTTLEYNDKETETGSKVSVGLLYESVNDSIGNHLLKITYDKLHILLKKQDGDQEYDASNASVSYDPVEKLLGVIKGSSIYITVNSKGDVITIKGSKEIGDKVFAAMQSLDEQIRKTLQEQVSQLIGETFIKNNLQQGFKLFPDSAIRVGDSWTRKDTQSAGIHYDAVTTYTLESLDNGIALIETESEVNTGNGEPGSVMGFSVITDLKGRQTGSIRANINSGIVLSNKSSTSLKGSIQVLGRDVPVKIKMKKEIVGGKM